MQRSLGDWGGNIVAFVLVVVLNVLSNTLPINGQSMSEISAKYPSLFTPAGSTFSIWGVIYIGLLLFVIYQALPGQRRNGQIASISRLFQFNCVANAAWIVVWHYDLLAISLLIMLLILASLVAIYRRLLPSRENGTLVERAIVRLPFCIYTGWITLATVANLSVLQNANGWDDIGLSAVTWTLVKLATVGAIAATVVICLRDIAFGFVVAWAAYGIAVKQVATPAVSGAAFMLVLLALFLIVRELVVRFQRH